MSPSTQLYAASVTASWNANPESNIAGYKLSYGSSSGVYTATLDVGKVTSTVVSVTAGLKYYFAVQAYNTSGATSVYSAEVSVTPGGTTTAPSISTVSPVTGAVGTPVIITGANFGLTKGTSTVTFNGAIATPTTWSATSLVVPVPTGATTGNVVVTVGGAASNGRTFTVTSVNAPPVLTNPGNQTSTTGATVSRQLSATDPNGTALTYSATGLPPGLSVTSATGVISGTAPATAGTFTVTATASDGSLTASQTFTWTITAAPAGITLVQHSGRSAGSTASASLAFPAVNTSGNFIAVAVSAGTPSQTFTISDTRGNTYREAARLNNSTSNTLALFYAENVAAGANTVTVSGATVSTLRFSVFEYRGIAASNSLDVMRTASGIGTLPNTGAVTTTASGDLLIGVVVTAAAANVTAGNGFMIERAVPALPGARIVVEDAVQASAGAASATATLAASDRWAAVLAAFKPAGTGIAPAITSLTPGAGPAGTVVMITGSNFGSTKGTSTVRFNGTTATPTTWSASSIAVPVPSGATTGNVVVTVGGAASNGQTFTVTTTAQISFVQHAYLVVPSGATAAVNVPGAQSAGNLNVVVVGWNDAVRTVQSVVDSKGNTYVRAVGPTILAGQETQSIYYAKNIVAAAAGANTVTVTFSGAASYVDVRVAEYRGLDPVNPLDGAVGATGSALTNDSGPLTTTSPNALLVGANTVMRSTTAAGSGYTSRVITAVAHDILEDRVVSVVGTYRATATVSSGSWVMQLAAFRAATVPAGGSVALMMSVAARPAPDDSSRASDYDGDGKSDLGVFTPSTGRWAVLQSSSNYQNSVSVVLGRSADVPVPGDYDGDGKADVAVYTPSTGRWSVLQSSTGYTSGKSTTWGVPGDVPLPGDYDGDGTTDVAVYRPSTGEWLLTLSATQTTTTVVLGASSDKPVAGDYDGDGRTDPAAFTPSTGAWMVATSSSNYAGRVSATIGVSSDVPVPGDYDGDGRMDMAVYRPSTGTWLILDSTGNYAATRRVTLGASADVPVPSDYDADGKADTAVFRPATGQWTIIKSSDGGTLTSSGGSSGAVPLPRHP